MAQTKHNFKQRLAFAAPLLIIGVVASFGFLVSVASAASISTSDVIALVNESRKEAGLTPLTENAKLSKAARDKAEDMIKNDYFAHTSPAGKTPWYWVKREGYSYKLAGENLAINYTDADDQHKAWMKSKTHRANIMNGNYREIGVATVEGKIDGERSIVTVQLFGTPTAAVAHKPTETTPVATKAVTPAIKGVEEVTPVNSGPAPVSDSTLPPVALGDLQTVQLTLATTGALDVSTMLSLILLSLSLFASPVAFLSRGYIRMWQAHAKTVIPTVPETMALMVIPKKKKII